MLNTKRKDSFRTVVKTLPRFMAIVVMLILAVAFFTGLQAAGPSMLETGRSLAKEGNLPDGKIQSTYGLNQADINFLEKDENLKIQPMRNIDAVMEEGGAVIHLFNAGDMLDSLFRVEKGRLPENDNEIALDINLLERVKLKIGDSINLEGLELGVKEDDDDSEIETDDEEEFPKLINKKFKVVGFLDSPLYLSNLDRGYRLDGKGSLDGFAVVSGSSIEGDLYTEFYYWDNTLKQDVFSENYNDASSSRVELIEEELDGQAITKTKNKKADLMQKVHEKEEELEDGKEQLKDAREKLDDGSEKIKDAKKQLKEAKADLEEAKSTIKEKEREFNEKTNLIASKEAQWQELNNKASQGATALEEARVKLDEGKLQLEEGRTQLEEAREELDSARSKINSGKGELSSARSKLDEAWEQIEDGKNKLNEGRLYLETLKNNALNNLPTESLEEVYEEPVEGEEATVEDVVLTNELPEELLQLEEELSAKSALLFQKEEELKEKEATYASKKSELSVAEATLSEKESLFNEKLAEFHQKEKLLEEKEQEWREKEAELIEGKEQLASARAQLDSGYSQLNQGAIQLEEAKGKVSDGFKTLKDKEKELKEKEQELADKEVEWGEKDEEVKEASDKIKKAKDKINDIPDARFITTARPDFSGYRLLENNAGKISQIADVFPVAFFALAILIAYVTIARMAQEEEVYLGTMAQMGYSRIMIMEKFIIYAILASFLGVALGLVIGDKVIPKVVIEAYKTLHPFNHPKYISQDQLKVWISVIAFLCTIVPAILIPNRTLRRSPASLVNQREDGSSTNRTRSGSRLLGLKSRWVFRNSFGKLSQALLVIIAVAASTALIVTGFGIKDSLNGTIGSQVDDILHYQGQVGLDEDSNQARVREDLLRIEGISSVVSVHTKQVTSYTDAYGDQSVNLLVPTQGEDLEPALSLLDVESDKKLNLTKAGVLASPTIYEGRNSSQELLIKDLDSQEFLVPVTGEFENYVWHLLVMTPEKYEEAFSEKADTNAFLVNYDSGYDARKIEEEITNLDGVESLLNLRQVKESASESMESLGLITVVLVIAAGALALVILYNIININVNERIQEIATLKVLGLFTSQITLQVLVEVLLQAVPGLCLGAFMGDRLTSYIIGIIKREDLAFKAMIKPMSYVYSIGLALVFIVLVMLMMAKRIQEIDKVEALKGGD